MPFDAPSPADARNLVATRRFLRGARAFGAKYPGFADALRAFCRFRVSASPAEAPFNAKDGRLAATLGHLRRCHLVHGKALVVYALAGRDVRLIAVVEHDRIEGNAAAALAAYGRALGEGAFEAAASLLDDPEAAALRAEVARLRSRAEADAASLARLGRENAEVWALAQEEAAGRTRAEAELAALRDEAARKPEVAKAPSRRGRHLAIRGMRHPRSRTVVTPTDMFGSAALAAEHHGISRQGAALRAREGLMGWRYAE